MAATEETLAALRDVREPDIPALQSYGDLLTAFSLGLMAALIVATILRSFTYRPRPTRERLLAELSAIRTLERNEQLLALARFAQRLSPEWDKVLPGLKSALYRPDAELDVEDVHGRIGELINNASRGGKP